MQNKRWIIDLILIVIIVVMGTFVLLEINQKTESISETQKETGSGEPTMVEETQEPIPSEEPVILGQQVVPAKDFELRNLAGETVALSNYYGQPVMVNFWATWCPPCREEMPLIQKFADNYDTRLVVLAINAGEQEAVVRNFVEGSGLELVFLLDPTNLAAELYTVRGFPTTLFIDEKGDLVATHIGGLDELLITHYLDLIGLPE